MTGYVRQSLVDIQPGQVVTAGPLNDEFNQLDDAFDAILGHTHDGTAGNGPPIALGSGAVSGTLPITKGGTGGVTAVAASDNLSTLGASIASAATTDLNTATGVHVAITGTNTITAFGTSPIGAVRYLLFTGILTLTFNATSLILPTGANIITTVGDTCTALSLGSGNWRIIEYMRGDGSALAFTTASSLTLTSTDAGATFGPLLNLFRNSASPAVSDQIGQISFSGKDAAGNTETYADIVGFLEDTTNGSEDATLYIQTLKNGVQTNTVGFKGTTSLYPTGSILDFNGADVTITHSANTLTFAGASSGYVFDGPLIASNGSMDIGSTSQGANIIYLKTNSNIDWGNGDVRITNPVANTLNFTGASSGYNFDAVINANAGQIAFPAAQNPSANVNTLDDYEEGAFTPTITGTTVAGAGTYSLQAGSYTKIGNRVYFEIDITWSAHTGTGNMIVSGLPFAATSTSAVVNVYSENLTFTAPVMGLIAFTGTTVILRSPVSGSTATVLAIDAAARLVISGSYTA